MENPNKVILIYSAQKKISSSFYNLLINNGFQAKILDNFLEALILIRQQRVSLLIYVKDESESFPAGIFRHLESSLIENGIPFFMYLNKYSYEDIVIALELGVDNFFFPTDDDFAIYNKINIELNKRRKINFLCSDKFLDFFKSSLVPMFQITDGKIHNVNNAFKELIPFDIGKIINKKAAEVLIFADNKNEILFKRILTGNISTIKLENVTFSGNGNERYDIKFFGQSFNGASIIAEILISQNQPLLAINSPERRTTSAEKIHITKREKEILALSADGLPIKLIAEKLNLSKRTVEKHRSNIMSKTGSKNIIEAINYIFDNEEKSITADPATC